MRHAHDRSAETWWTSTRRPALKGSRSNRPITTVRQDKPNRGARRDRRTIPGRLVLSVAHRAGLATPKYVFDRGFTPKEGASITKIQKNRAVVQRDRTQPGLSSSQQADDPGAISLDRFEGFTQRNLHRSHAEIRCDEESRDRGCISNVGLCARSRVMAAFGSANYQATSPGPRLSSTLEDGLRDSPE